LTRPDNIIIGGIVTAALILPVFLVILAPIVFANNSSHSMTAGSLSLSAGPGVDTGKIKKSTISVDRIENRSHSITVITSTNNANVSKENSGIVQRVSDYLKVASSFNSTTSQMSAIQAASKLAVQSALPQAISAKASQFNLTEPASVNETAIILSMYVIHYQPSQRPSLQQIEEQYSEQQASANNQQNLAEEPQQANQPPNAAKIDNTAKPSKNNDMSIIAGFNTHYSFKGPDSPLGIISSLSPSHPSPSVHNIHKEKEHERH
jgi:hypothetical protein